MKKQNIKRVHWPISLKTWNILKRAGCESIEQLWEITPNDLKNIKGLWRCWFMEICDFFWIRMDRRRAEKLFISKSEVSFKFWKKKSKKLKEIKVLEDLM